MTPIRSLRGARHTRAKAISGLLVPPAPIVVSTVGPVSKGVSVVSRLLGPS